MTWTSEYSTGRWAKPQLRFFYFSLGLFVYAFVGYELLAKGYFLRPYLDYMHQKYIPEPALHLMMFVSQFLCMVFPYLILRANILGDQLEAYDARYPNWRDLRNFRPDLSMFRLLPNEFASAFYGQVCGFFLMSAALIYASDYAGNPHNHLIIFGLIVLSCIMIIGTFINLNRIFAPVLALVSFSSAGLAFETYAHDQSDPYFAMSEAVALSALSLICGLTFWFMAKHERRVMRVVGRHVAGELGGMILQLLDCAICVGVSIALLIFAYHDYMAAVPTLPRLAYLGVLAVIALLALRAYAKFLQASARMLNLATGKSMHGMATVESQNVHGNASFSRDRRAIDAALRGSQSGGSQPPRFTD